MSKTLCEIEEELDKRVQNLEILSLPLRTVLSHIYIILDTLLNGNRLKGGPARKQAGHALISRLSYLLPSLLTKSDVEGLGVNALDAMNIFAYRHFSELTFLLQYGHFCELMPAVHRKWYHVRDVEHQSYAINHLSPDLARFELWDIVLSETAMPQEPRIDVTRYYDATLKLAAKAPELDIPLFLSVIRSIKDEYIAGERECPGISEEGFHQVTGVPFETFRKFRAGWAAYAICSQLIAERLFARAHDASEDEQQRLLGEAWEWLMPLMDSKFIDGLVCGIAGLRLVDYDLLMRFFVVDAKTRKAPQAGDGFFPPIIRISDGYLFSSHIVRATMSTRNILYVKNKLEPESFSFIANQMEPSLIAAAVKIFQRIPQVVVVPNVNWDAGEIDILVFNPDENAALQVQAKAAIPPEGARMTRAMETRVNEALSQLARLHREPPVVVDKLVSRAVDRHVKGVAIHDAVLSSSCFGTSIVWQRMKETGAVNLPLLAAVVNKLLRDNEQRPLARFATTTIEILDEWCSELTPGWTLEKAIIDDVTLQVPALELDGQRLRAIREAVQDALEA